MNAASPQLPATTGNKPQLPAELSTIGVGNGGMHIENLGQIEAVCNVLVQSKYLADKDGLNISVAQAVTKCMYGQKLGLDPLESINDLYMFQGQCQAYARLHARKIKEHPHYAIRIIEHNAEVCTIRCYDNVEKGPTGRIVDYGEPAGPDITFTIQQAKEAGLLNKQYSPWKVYPEEMLFNKVVTRAYRRYFPDIYKVTVVTVEEISDGEVMHAEIEKHEKPVKAAVARAAEKAAEAEILDVEPTQEQKLEAAAEIAEETGNVEAAKAIQHSLDKAEKITTPEAVALSKFAKECGVDMPLLMRHFDDNYGIKAATWTKELTKTQLANTKEWLKVIAQDKKQ